MRRGHENTLRRSALPSSEKIPCVRPQLTVLIGFSEEDLDLVELVKAGLIMEGDVLAYRRHFPSLSVAVEKDMLVGFSLYAVPLSPV